MKTQKQFMEGQMKGCKKYACQHSCCDDDQVEEWTAEYFAFHERMKDHIASIGIKMKFIGDRVQFKNCSDGRLCKLLTHSLNKDIDPRPIDCKIYPFVVDWDSINFDKKIVKLYYWDNECPLVVNKSIPEEFRKEAVHIIKRDFAVLFYGARFEVKIIDEVYKPHLKKS